MRTNSLQTIIVFGVSGSGKSTFAKALAEELNWGFIEADDYHSAAAIEKMSKGDALTDKDRMPWLQMLSDEVNSLSRSNQNTVLACSCLKQVYRDVFRNGAQSLMFILLDGDKALIAKRLRERREHFFPESLLSSQFDALEQPDNEKDVLTLDCSLALAENIGTAVLHIKKL